MFTGTDPLQPTLALLHSIGLPNGEENLETMHPAQLQPNNACTDTLASNTGTVTELVVSAPAI